MSELNFTHSNGNKVKLTTPDTLSANKTFKLPGADGSSEDVLKTDGSGALSFKTVEVDQWFLNQNATNGIVPGTYWTRKLKIGTGMTVSQDAAGRWAFPSTGIWKIHFTACFRPETDDNVYFDMFITKDSYSTTNWYARAKGSGHDTNNNQAKSGSNCVLFDVENISTHGFYFNCGSHGSGSYTMGSSHTNSNNTAMHTTVLFERMGDT